MPTAQAAAKINVLLRLQQREHSVTSATKKDDGKCCKSRKSSRHLDLEVRITDSRGNC